jgi:hypothetical protein
VALSCTLSTRHEHILNFLSISRPVSSLASSLGIVRNYFEVCTSLDLYTDSLHESWNEFQCNLHQTMAVPCGNLGTTHKCYRSHHTPVLFIYLFILLISILWLSMTSHNLATGHSNEHVRMPCQHTRSCISVSSML